MMEGSQLQCGDSTVEDVAILPKIEPLDSSLPVLGFTIDTVPEGMSKTQWKKKLRLQEKRKKWEKQKQEAKERRKEKRKQKIEEQKRETEISEIPQAKRKKVLEEKGTSSKSVVLPRGHYRKMSDQRASPVRVAIDCSFDDLMSANEILKLIKQVQRCYAANRRSVSPLQYYVTSFGGRMKSELNCRYIQTMEHEHWDIHYKTEPYLEVFGQENIVYLLAESSNVLTELDPAKAYIIGGLVDHNHQKGHCYKLAQEKGIAHARLPISEYVQLNCRRVLTINHVFEILLSFSTNGGDWKKAFYQVIPPRKLGETIDQQTSQSGFGVQEQSAQNTDEAYNLTSTNISVVCDQDTDESCLNTSPDGVPASFKSQLEEGSLLQNKQVKLDQNVSTIDQIISTVDSSVADDKLYDSVDTAVSKLDRTSDQVEETVDSSSIENSNIIGKLSPSNIISVKPEEI